MTTKGLIKDQQKLAQQIKKGMLEGKKVDDLRKQYEDLGRQIQRTEKELLNRKITFGGKLASSWSRSVKTMGTGTTGLGETTESLIKQQQKLAQQIKKGMLEGKKVDGLRKQYQKLGRQIQRTEKEQEQLNRQMKRAERFKSLGGMLGKGIFGNASGAVGQLGSMLVPGVSFGGGGLIATALNALMVPMTVNARTAEKVLQARQYGVDSQTYNVWDSLAGQYGKTGESIGSMYEEFLNKQNEYKETGKQEALSDAFEALGYKDFSLGGMSDIARFEKIIQDALEMKDATKASFALDSLFGAESAKFLMMLKLSGKSLKESIDEQKRYNMVTEEGAKGALEGHQALQNLQTILGSAVAEISGQLGHELAPDLRAIGEVLSEWFKGGGMSKITNFIRNDLYPCLRAFGSGVLFVGKVIFAVAKKLAWLLPDEQNDRIEVLKSLGRSGSVDFARSVAKAVGQSEWLEQRLREDPELITKAAKAKKDNLGFFFEDSEGFNADIANLVGPADKSMSFDFREEMNRYRQSQENNEKIWPALMQQANQVTFDRPSQQVTDNRRTTYQIEVYASEGQQPGEIADAVIDRAKAADVFNGQNRMYDVVDAW